MDSYPVTFDVEPPERWERIQLLLRLAVACLLAIAHASLGLVFGALYLTLPIVAAVLVSQRGPEAYLGDSSRAILAVLRWWNAFVAYMFFLTDRFPVDEQSLGLVHFEVHPGGSPSVGRALLRLVTSLPELLLVAILSWGAAIVWLISAVTILFTERVPEFAYAYLRFVVALQARLLAYHASLTDLYPPLDTTAHHGVS